MRVLYPGHRYALSNVKSFDETILQFVQQAPLHKPIEGTSCQEVIRALIDRVETLNNEIQWEGNATIINHLKQALAGFEARALIRKTAKGFDIHKLPIAFDGHILFQRKP